MEASSDWPGGQARGQGSSPYGFAGDAAGRDWPEFTSLLQDFPMNMLTKMALGLMGQLKPEPPTGDAASTIPLPPPNMRGGVPLMKALAERQSSREFDPTPLPEQILSELLWAAAGINRNEHTGRTFPSAMNGQEVDVYVALPAGVYLYQAATHSLQLKKAMDVRRVTGYQDFVDTAPLDLVLVADHSRMKLVPAAQRESYASVCAGSIAQNVYLYCASAGLAAVIRAWVDRNALSQTVGKPAVP
jgi:nitroreductase